MGKTANLRDYMADIARSNAEGGSGGGGSNFDFLEYVLNLKNLSTIKLLAGKGDVEEIDMKDVTWDDSGTVPLASISVDSDITDGDLLIQLTYKNGILFGNRSTSAPEYTYLSIDFGNFNIAAFSGEELPPNICSHYDDNSSIYSIYSYESNLLLVCHIALESSI